MRVNFMSPVRDVATGEIVQHLEIRFSSGQWDAFALLMQNAYSDDGVPDREKVLSALKEVLTRALASEESMRRTIDVPVDKVTGAEFRRIMNRAGKR